MNSRPYRYIASLPLLSALLLTACSDWENALTPPDPQAQETPITFSGSVVALPGGGTRADGSLVDIQETSLRQTAESGYSVGIFGCYTGQYQWAELVNTANLTDDEADAYTANLFYNQKADIEEKADTLTYSPLRFWPNNRLGSDKTQHEYVTLWAYYPYNPTSSIGQYGITMHVNEGEGIGRMAFTMNADAEQQVDFMMSLPVMDCNKDKYPLDSIKIPKDDDDKYYSPTPVPFKFYHMLSQVRVYAHIDAVDRVVYLQKDGKDRIADEDWFKEWQQNGTIMDEYGNVLYTKLADGNVEQTYEKLNNPEASNLTKEQFLALGLKIPDEENSRRWSRDDNGEPAIKYELSFNNIMTSTEFYPEYKTNADGTVTATIRHPEKANTMGYATVSNYQINSEWFYYPAKDKPVLNGKKMFGKDENGNENFARENILLMVPQELKDDQVPHIILKITDGQLSAQVTVNLLNMNIRWESGYVYCYAFVDELRPGDDKVQGPESITVVVDSGQYTDQW